MPDQYSNHLYAYQGIEIFQSDLNLSILHDKIERHYFIMKMTWLINYYLILFLQI